MSFRFRRSFKIAPGIHLNVGKKGRPSISVGVRGAHVTVGSKGVTTSVGIPGTGLSYTENVGHAGHVDERQGPVVDEVPPSEALPAKAARRLPVPSFPDNPVSYGDREAASGRRGYNVAIVVVALAIVAILAWPYIMRLLAGE